MAVENIYYTYTDAGGGQVQRKFEAGVMAELSPLLRSLVPLDLAAGLKSEVDLPCRGFGLRRRLLSPARELIGTLKGMGDCPVFIWGWRYRLLSVNDDGTFEAAEW